MTAHVILRYRSDHTVAASVRDGAGIHDVLRSAPGWSCSCGDIACCHVSAVRQVLEETD